MLCCGSFFQWFSTNDEFSLFVCLIFFSLFIFAWQWWSPNPWFKISIQNFHNSLWKHVIIVCLFVKQLCFLIEWKWNWPMCINSIYARLLCHWCILQQKFLCKSSMWTRDFVYLTFITLSKISVCVNVLGPEDAKIIQQWKQYLQIIYIIGIYLINTKREHHKKWNIHQSGWSNEIFRIGYKLQEIGIVDLITSIYDFNCSTIKSILKFQIFSNIYVLSIVQSFTFGHTPKIFHLKKIIFMLLIEFYIEITFLLFHTYYAMDKQNGNDEPSLCNPISTFKSIPT